MGWGSCGEDSSGRTIGYNHAGKCDHQGCKTKIDRGLSYACGGMHGHLGEVGCEKYFCSDHMKFVDKDAVEVVGLGDLTSGIVCCQCYEIAVKHFGELVASGDLTIEMVE